MFKVGDICRVINTICGHRFEIGEIVTIAGGTDNCWKCENDNGEQWWLDNRELELVNTNKGDKDMIKVGDLITYNGDVLVGALGLVGLVVQTCGYYSLIYYPAVEENSEAGVGVRFHDCDGEYSEKKYLAILNKNIKKVEIGQKLERVDGDGPFNFFKPGTEVTLLEHVDNKIVYVSGHIYGLKGELKQAVSIAQLRIKEETTTLGGDNMIKAGDKVRVLNTEGTLWEVGAVGTVDRVVNGVARVVADGFVTTNEMFALENLEKVVEEKVEKKAVLPKELFQIGDRVVANCTSDKGKYRLGDAGTVAKFRDDKDGADVGVKFDHKKDTITTWVYPDNIVHEDDSDDEFEPTPLADMYEEETPVEYGMIKIFNLTSLRKKGFEFDHQGNLNLSGTDKSLSGLMLNIIDGEFMAYEDDCEDNIYIVGDDGIEYVIDKALRGTLFKKI